MREPIKDYGLLFKQEIEKIDEAITKLQAQRASLVRAYALITGDSNGVAPSTARDRRCNLS